MTHTFFRLLRGTVIKFSILLERELILCDRHDILSDQLAKDHQLILVKLTGMHNRVLKYENSNFLTFDDIQIIILVII